jgi:NAD-dependent deacetylase
VRHRSGVNRTRGSILILTGAGISAESGVPTFRGPDGLWKNHRFEDLATPEAFARDPRLVWEWYGWRREVVARCAPNAAHLAIARLTLALRDQITLVTQNVDGLHTLAAEAEAAGGDPAPALPLELHGALFRSRCTRCDWRSEDRTPVDATSRESLPTCPDCGSLARPDIVWFGEALDDDLLDRSFSAASVAEVCVVIGTSSIVHPAASIPLVASRAGGEVIEINPDATPLSALASRCLRGRAVDLVPALLAELS